MDQEKLLKEARLLPTVELIAIRKRMANMHPQLALIAQVFIEVADKALAERVPN